MFLYKKIVFNTVIILLICLGIFACERKSNPFYLPETEMVADVDSITILALGDSYTIGTSVSENERRPNQLRDSLEVRGIAVKEVGIIARNGWTTANLLDAMNNQDIGSDYDLVGLLIGVNNQFQGRNIDEYEYQFQQLLELALTLADSDFKRVFVLSIPDYSVTPRGSRINEGTTDQEIDAFNAINKKLSNQFSVKYFDITTISRTAKNQYDLVASDGLHFSGKMYALWVEYILDDILKL